MTRVNRLFVAGLLGFAACADARAVTDAPEPPSPSARAIEPAIEPSAEVVEAVKAPPPPCPAEMAKVSDVCVDRYEAHLISRGPSGEPAKHPHDRRPEEGVVYEARSEAGVFPQAYISRVEAAGACAAAGKRLCTRREWQRACRYRAEGPPVTYPYGDRAEPGRCNTDKPHLLTLRFGADSRRWRYADFNDPSLSREPGFLARTGAYEGCVGEAGVHDMVGNLHEWVSDTADTAFEAALRSDGIKRSFQYFHTGNGVFMGGFYSTHGELGPGCTFTTIAHDPGYHDYSTGFRCCADAR